MLAAALLALAQPAAAQDDDEGKKVYTYVEQMPTLPIGGGMAGITAAIQERLIYPEAARRNKITGRVFVSFSVTSTGAVQDVKVVKGLGSGCDEAAVNAVQQLPRFVPGKQNGRAVWVSFTVPVNFQEAGATNAASVAQAAAPAANRAFTYVEQMPKLPGQPKTTDKTLAEAGGSYAADQAALQKAVLKNLVYPAEVLDGRSEGVVYTSFAVSPTGDVEDAKIGRGLCAACDAAVLAAVHKLPKLVPGRQNGQAVSVAMNLPVTLRSPSHIYRSEDLPTRATFPASTGLFEYIRRNLRVPAVVTTEKLRGRIRVDFIVRADGKVDAAEVKNSLCASCDAEALRLVRTFPAWTPARDAVGQPAATHQFLEIPMPLPDPAAPYSETEKVYTYASQMPTLLDGTRDYPAAITQALHYSDAVRREHIAGTVYVEFIVDADGLVRKPRVVRSLCVSCDQAVLDAINRVGPFTPGRQNDQAVPVQVTATVKFAPPAATK